MSLVGDVIVQAREAGPDPAAYLAPLTGLVAVASNPTVPGFIPVGTYYVVATVLNSWGESLASNEEVVTIAGPNNSIQVTFPPLPPPTTAVRIYFGSTGGGTQSTYYQYAASAHPGEGSLALIITITDRYSYQSHIAPYNGITFTSQTGSPPTKPTAMLPDTDGSFVGAATMFRWLNEALVRAVHVAGGIPSLTGVQAISGQAMYRVPGKWISFTNYWYDGWPVDLSKRRDIFLHNTVTSVSGMVSIEEISDSTIIQFWPQPTRTGATVTISGNITATDTTIPLAGVPGVLPIGLVLIESEIVGYSGASGSPLNLTGCIRGLSGTTAAAHPGGTAGSELNIRLSGFRHAPQYSVGSSTSNLTLPPGWDQPLTDYVISQYRRAEQQHEEADKMEKDFDASIQLLAKASRPKMGKQQIGWQTREIYPGGLGGGILLQ